LRALFQPAKTVRRVTQPEHDGAALRAAFARRLAHGQALRIARQMSAAIRGKRTFGAGRLARPAHGGAQIHQPLRVGGHVLRLGQQAARERPELARGGRGGNRIVDAVTAAEHALHIAVENGGALVEAERGNRRRRGGADARQRGEAFRRLRERAAMRLSHDLRAPVQIAARW
jgi:hypothetical protein